MVKTSLIYSTQLPSRKQFPLESVVLYDSVLDNAAEFKLWRKNFAFSLPLKAGESLKTLSSLTAVLKALAKMEIPQTTSLTFIAVGGGSVGDFVGFIASVFLRGRFFVQIPSTWLAAVDSAHGGKNGLNFDKNKNQIGTFYPAHKIYLSENLLRTQPTARKEEAMGEVIKASIINSKETFEYLEKKQSRLNNSDFFRLLPTLVTAKMDIVKADPFETNGLRRVLNLGHTIGHVLEGQFKLAHGDAVKLGILFSARWSNHKRYLNSTQLQRITNLILDSSNGKHIHLQKILKKISKDRWLVLLKKDKKITSLNTIDFIFIKNIGKVHRQKVSMKEILSEIQRQCVEL